MGSSSVSKLLHHASIGTVSVIVHKAISLTQSILGTTYNVTKITVTPPFQILSCSGFFRDIAFTMYLDIMYI